MSKLSKELRKEIYERDNYRCRWCGQTNAIAYDVHHIEYRRGDRYDVPENLILLCRQHHNYVHDSYRISKEKAQRILFNLLESPARTGAQLERSEKRSNGNNSLPRVGRLLSSEDAVDKES